MRIAFYAPMKAPDHPVPSGDRQMARLLVEALDLMGHEVEVVSRLRTHLPAPDPVRFGELRVAADAEADAVAGKWLTIGAPELWLTYHNYYKAPDLLGPGLVRRFGLPYAVAEASHAPRRGLAWGHWAALADEATRAADLHVCFTTRDRVGIEPLLRSGAAVVDLPPFIADRTVAPRPDPATPGEPVTIVTVAMMRTGDKLQSYRFLAAALTTLLDQDWTIRLIGDGVARSDIEAAFAHLPPGRVVFCGELGENEILEELRTADILAWPGFGEAFGLAYLEAQLAGVPVVALDVAGVGAVMRPGETGLLVSDHTPDAYAAALRMLVNDRRLGQRLGRAAAAWVRSERTLARASVRLDEALSKLLATRGPAHAR